MHGIFLAAGPAFNRGVVVRAFENVHVYHALAGALGITPAPNDGDPAVARRLLRQAGPEVRPCVGRAMARARDMREDDVMWNEFRVFIARGNVVDLAVGVVIGAAFGRVVGALVEGIIMPPFGLLLGRVDFSSLFYVLDSSAGIPVSIADAKAKGIPVIAYGQFVNEVIAFLIVAFAVFLLVKQVNRIKSAVDRPSPDATPTTKECPFCASTISIKAARCPHCTSELAVGSGQPAG